MEKKLFEFIQEHSLTISLDADDTFNNLSEHTFKTVIKQTKQEIINPKYMNFGYYFENNLGKEATKAWGHWENYQHVKLLRDTKPFIKTLKTFFDNHLQIITASVNECGTMHENKDKYIEEHLNINPNNIFHTSTKYEYTKNGILVDDGPHNIADHLVKTNGNAILFNFGNNRGWATMEHVEKELKKRHNLTQEEINELLNSNRIKYATEHKEVLENLSYFLEEEYQKKYSKKVGFKKVILNKFLNEKNTYHNSIEFKEEILLEKIEEHLSQNIHSIDIIKEIAKNMINGLKQKNENIFSLPFIQEFLKEEHHESYILSKDERYEVYKSKETSFSEIEKYYKEEINYSLPNKKINNALIFLTNNIRIGQLFEYIKKIDQTEEFTKETNFSYKNISTPIIYLSKNIKEGKVNIKTNQNNDIKNNITLKIFEDIYYPNPFSITTLFNDLENISITEKQKDLFHLPNSKLLELLKQQQINKDLKKEKPIYNFDLIRSKHLNEIIKNEKNREEFHKNLLKKDTVRYIIKNKQKQVEQTYLGFNGLNKTLEDYPLVKENLKYNELNSSNIIEAYTRIEELIAIKYGKKLLPNLIFAPIVELEKDNEYHFIFNEDEKKIDNKENKKQQNIQPKVLKNRNK
jgi:hypothetical protein